MNRIVLLSIILFMIIACEEEKTKNIDVSQIAIDFSVDRFEQKFYSTTPETLPDLKNEYPYLFPVQKATVLYN